MNDTVIILPAHNEAENLKELLPELKQFDVDILVVNDNSTDDTQCVAEELSVNTLTRAGKKGLSSAVLDGIRHTEHPNIIVMDADQQHPPSTIPKMLEALNRSEVVIASRNIPGGGYEGFSAKRRIISLVANLLALPLIPKITDRMTGFFGFRRSVLDGANPSSEGFKIGLEIFARGKYSTFEEVPFVFLPRSKGESKLTSKVMLSYVKQLIPLYLNSTIFKFACVGASGTVIKLGGMLLFTEFAGLFYLLSYAIAFILSVVNNYTWNSLWTFRGKRSSLSGLSKYFIISSITLCTNELILYTLTGVFGVWYMFSASIGVLTAFILNFVLSRRFVWK